MHEVFEQPGVRTVFTDASGIYPEYVELCGRRELFRTRLSLVLEDGCEYHPTFAGDPQARRYRVEHADRLEFYGLVWKAGQAAAAPFTLDLRYEFDDAGTTFVRAFFHGETLHAPAIRQFRLTHDLQLECFEEVRWEVFPWPPQLTLQEVAYNAPERFLAPGENRDYPGRLLPKVGFTCWKTPGMAAYLEFFLEGGGALDGRPGNLASRIRWNGRHPRLEYDFIAAESRRDGVPWQWRCQWGWQLAAATPERVHPPLRMYHYLDNFQRYPTDRQIAKMARTGADVLIVHENWRSDLQNDTFPHDPAELRRVIFTAHSHGLRVALYVRGIEPSVSQEYAPWSTSGWKRSVTASTWTTAARWRSSSRRTNGIRRGVSSSVVSSSAFIG
ncbi:MAG: hypothetical protein J6Y80_06865 [Victivallales bacterium]|nr:hypothetical protein [Victivallales bacterium]